MWSQPSLDLSSYILGMNNWPVYCNVALTFESLDKIIWHENFGISLTWCYLFFSILENLIWQNHWILTFPPKHEHQAGQARLAHAFHRPFLETPPCWHQKCSSYLIWGGRGDGEPIERRHGCSSSPFEALILDFWFQLTCPRQDVW